MELEEGVKFLIERNQILLTLLEQAGIKTPSCNPPKILSLIITTPASSNVLIPSAQQQQSITNIITKPTTSTLFTTVTTVAPTTTTITSSIHNKVTTTNVKKIKNKSENEINLKSIGRPPKYSNKITKEKAELLLKIQGETNLKKKKKKIVNDKKKVSTIYFFNLSTINSIILSPFGPFKSRKIDVFLILISVFYENV